MNQARLVYCSFGIDCQCFYFFYKGASIFCFDWMTKGMSQLETTGPALADYLGWKSDLGRASCRVIGLCLSPNNFSACLDIEKNMLIKLRSLSILRLSAVAENLGRNSALINSGPFDPSCFSTTSDCQDTAASLFCLVDHSWHES
ncbi:hypothetical protein V6N11_021741 [Hibiscus sabdariffa]|uniref:Uncharacterized protein n=1 Tax=Hibiscus sabdariffa TaxID=183260 RepID=A0ABR2THT3_9ROSI